MLPCQYAQENVFLNLYHDDSNQLWCRKVTHVAAAGLSGEVICRWHECISQQSHNFLSSMTVNLWSIPHEGHQFISKWRQMMNVRHIFSDKLKKWVCSAGGGESDGGRHEKYSWTGVEEWINKKSLKMCHQAKVQKSAEDNHWKVRQTNTLFWILIEMTCRDLLKKNVSNF